MNLSSLQAEIGRLLNDPNNTRWPVDTITARINLAQTEVQGYTNAVKTSESLTPVAGTSTVSLNANTMNVMRMTKTLFNTSVKPFNGITREEIDFRYPDWQQWSQGEPLYWIYDATNQQIILAPTPDATNAISNGLTCWESRKPADLSSASDIPFDSNNQMIPYHMSIVHWVVAQCWMDDGTPEALGKARFHKSGNMLKPGEYEKQLGRIMAQFDDAVADQEAILWQAEGGRTGSWGFPSKSNPIPF